MHQTSKVLTYQTIKVDLDSKGIYTIALNRPEKRNAFNDQVISEILTALDRASEGPARVILLKGEGRHFSAGADLAWMQRMVTLSYEDNLADAHQLATMLRTLNEYPLPVVAAVRGSAFGGAVGLVACADIALATPDTRFALSEIKLGLIPATISPYVIDAIGARACRRLFLTGEIFDARQAQTLGLVHEVAEDDAFDQKVSDLVAHLATLPANALAEAKRLIQEVSHPEPQGSVYEYTCQRIAQLRVAPEGQEGLKAFLEKRPPQWPNLDASNNRLAAPKEGNPQ